MSCTSGPSQSDLSRVHSAALESGLGKRERKPDESPEPESTESPERELKRLRREHAAMRQQLDDTRTSRAVGEIVHGGVQAVMYGASAFGSALWTVIRTGRNAYTEAIQENLRALLYPHASDGATRLV